MFNRRKIFSLSQSSKRFTFSTLSLYYESPFVTCLYVNVRNCQRNFDSYKAISFYRNDLYHVRNIKFISTSDGLWYTTDISLSFLCDNVV